MALRSNSIKRRKVRIDNNRTNNSKRKKRKSDPEIENIIDKNLEFSDPTPEIPQLFKSLDSRFFAGLLSKNLVKVVWSTSMDLKVVGSCAPKRNGEEIIIKLNERILMFRSRQDLVETLLHEMVHAYLCIKHRDDDHGPNFRRIMNRINLKAGTNITIYLDVGNEVALYENRLWRCNGKCSRRSPQFGLFRNKFIERRPIDVKRHQKNCGGNIELLKPPTVILNLNDQIEQLMER